MKELSIEEKAKRYDEAIEKLYNLYDNYDTISTLIDIKEEQKSVDVFNIYEKTLLEKFKQAVYNCAWRKVTCKVEGESKEEYAERWSEQFLLIVRDWADDYIDFTIEQKVRRSYDNGYKDAIKNLNSAWSEDVQQWIDAIIKDYEEWYDVNKDHRATIQVKINILKSLKDRYTWKPSEEQMEALDDFIYAKYPNIEKHGAAVKSLYQDLKKLREE